MKQNNKNTRTKASDKDNVMQVLPFPSPFCLFKLCLVMWLGWELGESRGWRGSLSGGAFVGWATWNIVFCLEREGGMFLFILFFIFCFCCLLTVARSRVLDFQQHPQRTSSLLHGTFAGICGVVTGTHRLVCPTLRTGLITQRAAASAHPSIPQALLPCAALDVLTWLSLDAFSLIRDSDGPAEETGSSSQVTRAGIDDPVVSTQVLLRRRHLGANPITRHTICVICLVHDARGAAGAQDVTAGFLAFSLVLHVQVGMAFAFRLQQRAFVFVGLPIWSADWAFPGDVGTVWRAHAARLTSPVHLAPLSRPTVNIVAGFFARYAIGGSAIEDHPPKERAVGDVLLGPGRPQPSTPAAFLPAHPRHVEHLAPPVLPLLQPAVPSLNFLMFHEVTKPYEQEKNARVKMVFQHPKHDGEAKWTTYLTQAAQK